MSALSDEKILCIYVGRRGGAGPLRSQRMMVKARADLLAEGLMALRSESHPHAPIKTDKSSLEASLSDEHLWKLAIQKLAETKYPSLRTWDATPEGLDAFLAEAAELGLGEDAAGLLKAFN